ncbi:MAG: ABC transporter ATP-binding protein [Proteobacteria bacterium]|nr:ABC transporter ATP-binding protein [Pseudomonadota bacterium]
MKQITIKNLTIQYDDLIVLENFNAEFDTGIHWIQGLNGSGKSSLLKSLCGIVSVSSDTINIMGFDLKKQAIKAKTQLCFVPDKPEVYPFMTGIGFLELVAKIKGVKLSTELFDFIDAINLTQFKDIEFSQMSFGTRRKFTLCGIFIGNPSVVLLDEPFSGLDKYTIKQFAQWLEYAKQQKCILIVSHDTHILQDLFDSVTIIGTV